MTEHRINEEQGRGCAEQIFVVKMTMGKYLAKGKQLLWIWRNCMTESRAMLYEVC